MSSSARAKSKAMVDYFFNQVDPSTYECVQCHKVYRQKAKSGYSNLRSHLTTCIGPHYEKTFAEQRAASCKIELPSATCSDSCQIPSNRSENHNALFVARNAPLTTAPAFSSRSSDDVPHAEEAEVYDCHVEPGLPCAPAEMTTAVTPPSAGSRERGIVRKLKVELEVCRSELGRERALRALEKQRAEEAESGLKRQVNFLLGETEECRVLTNQTRLQAEEDVSRAHIRLEEALSRLSESEHDLAQCRRELQEKNCDLKFFKQLFESKSSDNEGKVTRKIHDPPLPTALESALIFLTQNLREKRSASPQATPDLLGLEPMASVAADMEYVDPFKPLKMGDRSNSGVEMVIGTGSSRSHKHDHPETVFSDNLPPKQHYPKSKKLKRTHV